MALAKISSAPTVPEIIALVNQIIDEKLGVGDKAADSDKLDGQDSTYYATATALANKLDTTAKAADSAKLGGTAASSFAKLASPAFTGTPTAPTAASTTNNTQIATTAFVKSLVGAANNGGIIAASLAQNGYVKFANGLILQWGFSASAGEGSRKMTFPIAYTTSCLNVQGTGSNVSSQATVAWSGLSKTGFTLIIGNSGAIYYIAIGY